MNHESMTNLNSQLERYRRPEDELETEGVVAVNLRERRFSAEGGFQDLLNLKLVINDLSMLRGFLSYGNQADGILDIIKNPKVYAYAALGFGINVPKEAISETELELALKKYLEKAKVSMIDLIGKYIEIITKYKNTTESKMLDTLEFYLNKCKEAVQGDDWEAFTEKATQAQSDLHARENIVRICCGGNAESDETKEIVRNKRTTL